MSAQLALTTIDVRAFLNMFIVGELIRSAMPFERLGALGITDAALSLRVKHLTRQNMGLGLLQGTRSVSTITTMETGAQLVPRLGWYTGRVVGTG